jgi:hypothetical protein
VFSAINELRLKKQLSTEPIIKHSIIRKEHCNTKEGKVFPACGMKAYRRSRSIPLLILNHGTRLEVNG